LKRTALIFCFVGVMGLLLLGAFEKPERLDLNCVAAIAH
jgi:hypothetical protein